MSGMDTFLQLTTPQQAQAPASSASVPAVQQDQAAPLPRGMATFNSLTQPAHDPREQWAGGPEPSFLARMGRGMMDMGQGLKQGYLQVSDMVTGEDRAGDYQKAVDDELAIYEANAGDGFDWGRMAGQVVATAPLAMTSMPASLPMKMLAGGAQGAASAGAMYTKEGESRAGNALVGAVGGAAVPVAFSALGEVGGRAWAALKALKDKGSVAIRSERNILQVLQDVGVDMAALSATQKANLVQAARSQLTASGRVDGDALKRKMLTEELGFVGDSGATQSQLTRSPQQWAQERNLSKTPEGGELTGRYMNQDARFAQLKDEIVGAIPNDVDAGELSYNAINSLWKTSQDAVGSLYKKVREQIGESGAVFTDRLLSSIDELSNNRTGKAIHDSVKRQIDWFKGKNDSDTLTIAQAEELRKFIGGLADGNDPNLQRLKRAYINALDDDVIDSAGDDVFKAARDAARERFQAFETKLVKSIVEDTTSPDKAFARVLRADARDLIGLRDNLLKTPDGQAAWQAIRQQVINHLWSKAQKEVPGSTEMFLGSNFQKELNTLGPRRLGVLFSDQERQKLFQVAEAGIAMTRTPPYAAVNWSNTAPAMHQLAQAMGNDIPFIGSKISEAAKRGADRARLAEALSGSPTNPGLRQGDIDVVRSAVNDFAGSGIRLPLGKRLPPLPLGMTPQGLGSTAGPITITINRDRNDPR